MQSRRRTHLSSRRAIRRTEALGEGRQHFVHPSLPGGLGLLRLRTPGRTRMRLHANARLTPKARSPALPAGAGERRPLAEAAEAAGVSGRTARTWLARYRAEGPGGLEDRSSRPRRSPRRTAPEPSLPGCRALGVHRRDDPPRRRRRQRRALHRPRARSRCHADAGVAGSARERGMNAPKGRARRELPPASTRGGYGSVNSQDPRLDGDLGARDPVPSQPVRTDALPRSRRTGSSRGQRNREPERFRQDLSVPSLLVAPRPVV